jgi:hypothetical protein
MNTSFDPSDFIAISRTGASDRTTIARAARNNTLYHAATGGRFAVAADAWYRTGVQCVQQNDDNVKARTWAQRTWLGRARTICIGR